MPVLFHNGNIVYCLAPSSIDNIVYHRAVTSSIGVTFENRRFENSVMQFLMLPR